MKERFFESQYLGKDLLLGKILRVTQRALTQNPIRCMDNSALFLKHSCITGCSEVCACCWTEEEKSENSSRRRWKIKGKSVLSRQENLFGEASLKSQCWKIAQKVWFCNIYKRSFKIEFSRLKVYTLQYFSNIWRIILNDTFLVIFTLCESYFFWKSWKYMFVNSVRVKWVFDAL